MAANMKAVGSGFTDHGLCFVYIFLYLAAA